MKLGEFLGERMGRVVMQGVFVLAAAVILLVTGTQGQRCRGYFGGLLGVDGFGGAYF